MGLLYFWNVFWIDVKHNAINLLFIEFLAMLVWKKVIIMVRYSVEKI